MSAVLRADAAPAVSLAGQTVLVAGGAGAVGEGIVRGLLATGATVAAVSRERARLDAVRERLPAAEAGRFVPVVGNLATAKAADALREQVAAEVGTVHHAVASLGGSWAGPALADLALAEWRRALDDNLTAHFMAARTFLPVVAARPGGSYTFIVGAAAEEPVPGAAPLSVALAGLLMLKRAFAREFRHTGVRVNEVMLYAPVTRDRPAQPGRGAITAEEVGEFIAFLASPNADPSPETIHLPDRAARDVAMGWLRA